MTEKQKIVVDSWAWIEYFEGSQSGEKVRNYVEDENNKILTSSVSMAEIVSKFMRKNMDPQKAVTAISRLSRVLLIDMENAVFAGELHAGIKSTITDFGLADAFILAVARQNKAKILTGDPHFKGFKEAIFLSK